MEPYKRKYPQFSLCGLNCGLCPRYHTKSNSRCPGCGGETFNEKHPSCGIISCAKRQGGIEYCHLCDEYPCKKYDNADAKDSFITHRNQLKDLEKIVRMGIDAYQAELNEKINILNHLLDNYDDGKCKNFYCLAINLLELQDIRDVTLQIPAEISGDTTTKEKATAAVCLFQTRADEKNILLKLRK